GVLMDQEPQLVAMSPDGKFLAAGYDKSIAIWNLDRRERINALVGHADQVAGLAFSLDGQRLASASHDQTVRVWDFRAGTELNNLRGHTDFVEMVFFSNSGESLVSVGLDGNLRRWNLATKADVLTYRGHLPQPPPRAPRLKEMPAPLDKKGPEARIRDT